MRGEKSMRDFAKMIGVSHPLISLWEKGNIEPSQDNLEKIAKIRGCSLGELMDEIKFCPEKNEPKEPFDKILDKLPNIIIGLDDNQIVQLMEKITEGLRRRNIK